MYIATKTIKVASKGLSAAPYELEEGKPVINMDAHSLRHYLDKGYIRKIAEAVTEAPEKKVMALVPDTKSGVMQRIAKIGKIFS